MPMLAELVEVVIGVDTHKDTHTAAVVTAATGAVLEQATVPADPDGYQALLDLAAAHPGLRAFALEGSGGYGAGLARHLAAAGEVVVELDRPARPARWAGAKSDPIDAVRAARDALARTRLAVPKSGPTRAALAAYMTARRGAVEAATTTERQLHALVITAPEAVRARFRGQSTRAMVTTATRLRPHTAAGDVEAHAVLDVLRDMARRVVFLREQADDHEKAIKALVSSWRPDLLQLAGVGPIVAAAVLTTWSHPGRVHSEAALAMLAGAAPIPASSGKTVRYRLNRSGDRQLNRALHTIVLTRLQRDERTRAYAARRRAEGKTDREIKRCLKRYIARELYRLLESPPSAPSTALKAA
ncbi:IS110 family transposase [Pseudokineococcus basanitobsidens]|uniref:IS110 family transposase n=1 Tax=Pseudokineococcus basanitobsidens TaxID=1926649 RepID=A0ABU8RPN5_9ACTN